MTLHLPTLLAHRARQQVRRDHYAKIADDYASRNKPFSDWLRREVAVLDAELQRIAVRTEGMEIPAWPERSVVG